MGAREPEAPKAFPRTTNILNKEPEWVPKISLSGDSVSGAIIRTRHIMH